MSDHKTIREITGEIWAELLWETNFGDSLALKGMSHLAAEKTVDVIMGVLARYHTLVITNDEHMPVLARKLRFPPKKLDEISEEQS